MVTLALDRWHEAATWDSIEHPRAPAGSASGGEFTAGDKGGPKKTAGGPPRRRGARKSAARLPAGVMAYDPSRGTGTGYGMRGGDPRVKQLQEALNRLGLTDSKGKKLAVDGKLGPLTTQAVKAAQKRLGVTVDGQVTPAFLKQLAATKTVKARESIDANGRVHDFRGRFADMPGTGSVSQVLASLARATGGIDGVAMSGDRNIDWSTALDDGGRRIEVTDRDGDSVSLGLSREKFHAFFANVGDALRDEPSGDPVYEDDDDDNPAYLEISVPGDVGDFDDSSLFRIDGEDGDGNAVRFDLSQAEMEGLHAQLALSIIADLQRASEALTLWLAAEQVTEARSFSIDARGRWHGPDGRFIDMPNVGDFVTEPGGERLTVSSLRPTTREVNVANARGQSRTIPGPPRDPEPIKAPKAAPRGVITIMRERGIPDPLSHAAQTDVSTAGARLRRGDSPRDVAAFLRERVGPRELELEEESDRDSPMANELRHSIRAMHQLADALDEEAGPRPRAAELMSAVDTSTPDRAALAKRTVKDLQAMARERRVKGFSRMRKPELVDALSDDTADELAMSERVANNAAAAVFADVETLAGDQRFLATGSRSGDVAAGAGASVIRETADALRSEGLLGVGERQARELTGIARRLERGDTTIADAIAEVKLAGKIPLATRRGTGMPAQTPEHAALARKLQRIARTADTSPAAASAQAVPARTGPPTRGEGPLRLADLASDLDIEPAVLARYQAMLDNEPDQWGMRRNMTAGAVGRELDASTSGPTGPFWQAVVMQQVTLGGADRRGNTDEVARIEADIERLRAQGNARSELAARLQSVRRTKTGWTRRYTAAEREGVGPADRSPAAASAQAGDLADSVGRPSPVGVAGFGKRSTREQALALIDAPDKESLTAMVAQLRGKQLTAVEDALGVVRFGSVGERRDRLVHAAGGGRIDAASQRYGPAPGDTAEMLARKRATRDQFDNESRAIARAETLRRFGEDVEIPEASGVMTAAKGADDIAVPDDRARRRAAAREEALRGVSPEGWTVIDAVRSLEDPTKPSDFNWVRIMDLRDELAARGMTSREQQDAAINDVARRLNQHGMMVVPENNQRAMTDAQRAAGLQRGDQRRDLISIAPEIGRSPAPAPVSDVPGVTDTDLAGLRAATDITDADRLGAMAGDARLAELERMSLPELKALARDLDPGGSVSRPGSKRALVRSIMDDFSVIGAFGPDERGVSLPRERAK